MNCGDVVLVLYPFTDMTGSKVRPAIVVSNDAFNRGEDLVFVPVSSSPEANDPYVYPIPQQHRAFRVSGLKTDSYVKFTKVMALSKIIIRRRLGSLDADTLRDLSLEISSLFQPKS
ncbi:MAG: type II toxin-antitoxin system PemK/MazF family toxin [Phycisphaerae bacterium]